MKAIKEFMKGWSFSIISKKLVLWVIQILMGMSAVIALIGLILVIPIAVLEKLEEWVNSK